METKSFELGSTALDEIAGKVSGYAAIFGTVDSGGDRIMPGAFKKTIQERFTKYGSIPLTWNHVVDDPYGPLGKVTLLREDSREQLPPEILALAPDAKGGLYFEGQITLTDVNKQRMLHLAKGSVTGQSIGYVPIGDRFVKDGIAVVRELPEIKLFEIAHTPIGMMDAAQLTGLKSAALNVTPTASNEEKAFLAYLQTKAPTYADPDNEKWPIDTEEHVHAALGYYNGAKDRDGNSAADWTAIGKRIATAASSTYDKPYKLAGGKVTADSDGKSALHGTIQRKATGEAQEYVRARLQDALEDAYPYQSSGYDYCCSPMMADADGPGCAIRDVYQDTVIVWDQGYDALWEVPYALGANGDVTLDQTAARLVKVTYAPVSMTSEEAGGIEQMRAARVPQTKAGRRNAGADETRLKTAHDLLHESMGIPHHDMTGTPDDAQEESTNKSAKAALALRLQTSAARMRVALAAAA